MDKLNKEQRRKNMQAVKSKGSKIETAMAKALFAKGYRYRKNDSKVFGKPDIILKKYKLAIFIDSEFWHGKNWKTKKYEIKSNRKFWWKKIEGNIKRDKLVRKKLTKDSWQVLRFWGKDIEKKLSNCITKVESKIDENKRTNKN